MLINNTVNQSVNNTHHININTTNTQCKQIQIKKCLFLWKGRSIRQISKHLFLKKSQDLSGHRLLRTRDSNNSKRYRLVDFNNSFFGIPGIVVRIEYDPYRSSFISLVLFKNGICSYFLSLQNLNINDIVVSSLYNNKITFFKRGFRTQLRNIPVGTTISQIEKLPFSGAIFTRSAGTSSILVRRYKRLEYNIVKLKSGKHRLLSDNCFGMIGSISNNPHKFLKYYKAGQRR